MTNNHTSSTAPTSHFELETYSIGYRKFRVDGRSYRAIRRGDFWDVFEVLDGSLRDVGASTLGEYAEAKAIWEDVRA